MPFETRDHRLFVGIPTTDTFQAKVKEFQSHLQKKGAKEGIRWTFPSDLHLTLKFLGGVEEGQVEEISQALRDSIQAIRPFSIQPEGFGVFGGRKFRIFWLGLAKVPAELHNLVEQIEQALNPLGFPREDRPYTPHFTVARVQRSAPKVSRKILKEGAERCSLPFGTFEVNRISLFQTQTDPTPPRYAALRGFPLLS